MMKDAILSAPSLFFKLVKMKGRFTRILSASASITSRFAPTRGAKSISLILIEALQIRAMNSERRIKCGWDGNDDRSKQQKCEPGERAARWIKRCDVVQRWNVSRAGDEPDNHCPHHQSRPDEEG